VHELLIGRVESRWLDDRLRDENAVKGIAVQQGQPADKSSRVRAERQFGEPGIECGFGQSRRGSNAKSPRPSPALMAISQMLAALNNTSVSPLSIVERVSPSSLPGSASAQSRTLRVEQQRASATFECLDDLVGQWGVKILRHA